MRDATGIGVDGCRGGWIAVAVRNGQVLALRSADSFLTAIDFSVDIDFSAAIDFSVDIDMPSPSFTTSQRPPTCSSVLVDMPMGLTLDGKRGLEAALRARLPKGRKSSVFPVPARVAFQSASHADASDRNAAVCGKRIPIQTYQIMPKIAELDTCLRTCPELQARCSESHPEGCFHVLAQCLANDGAQAPSEIVLPPKRSVAGRVARRSILHRHGLRTGALRATDSWLALLHNEAGQQPSADSGLVVAEDDLLDALCLALVASRPSGWEIVSDPLRARDEQGIALQVILPDRRAWHCRQAKTLQADAHRQVQRV